MESNIKGLVSAGHEMASELKAECGAVDMRSVAKLLSDLATQLEVQLARANALAEDQQKAIESIKQADSAVKLAHEKFSALAAEHGIQIAINELLALAPRLDKRAVDALSVAVEHLCKLIKKEAVSEQN
ncbi:hypothetical protein [Escherichia coli]|uniref:hypothetical protein n=1 Tax=Escherichia coli TaxID=562 RepID=UPI00203CDBDD|nr:hypothetical protein [Escherichia coli]